MDLQALLKANPEAQKEVDALVASAKEEGRKGLHEAQAVVIPFLTAEVYPVAVHKLAADVLAGKVGKEALISTVTVLDAQREEAKSAAAKEEGKETGETAASGGAASGLSTDGVIRSAEDAEAAVTRLRAGV